MVQPKKVTKREFDNYVQEQLLSNGFSRAERDAVQDAFFSDIEDAEQGERSTFLHDAVPGVSEDELKRRMELLRDPHSPISKNSKYPLHKYPAKLDVVEKVMKEALEGSKERHWF